MYNIYDAITILKFEIHINVSSNVITINSVNFSYH